MSLVTYFLLISWAFILIYWIITSRSVKTDKEVRHSVTKLQITIIWFLFAGFLFLGNLWLPIPSFKSNLSQNLSILLTALGLIVTIMARRKLGKNWSKSVTLKRDHTLITTGVYAYIRHPIYTGFLLMGLGTVMYLQTLTSLILLVIVFFYFKFKMRQEEELLMREFKKDYAQYRLHTRLLIPYLY